jgi:L-fuculose-phosphate aldolase
MQAARAEVAALCQRLVSEKLVVGTAGNVSIRVGDKVAISPSGFDYLSLTGDEVAVVDLAGNQIEGDYKPSSEVMLHLAIYNTSDHQSIVHTHAVSSTALSLVVDQVPLSHYYSALFGGAIRVAPYATYGSADLAAGVQLAMKNRYGALMSNHGAVVASSSGAKAFELAQYLEYVCEIHLKAMATGSPIKLLNSADLDLVLKEISTYGQSKPKQ